MEVSVTGMALLHPGKPRGYGLDVSFILQRLVVIAPRPGHFTA